MVNSRTLSASALFATFASTSGPASSADLLPSWNEGKAEQSIVDFVERVTKSGWPDFVSVPERIAVFDNDGTLWCEQPIPVQLYFLLDRVKVLAPQHPDWQTKEPFSSLLKGDLKTALAGGDRALMELFAATHTGTSSRLRDRSCSRPGPSARSRPGTTIPRSTRE